MMLSMGFPEKKVIKALKSCDMNMERATDWLFSHMDDPDDDEPMADESEAEAIDVNAQYKCEKPGRYAL